MFTLYLEIWIFRPFLLHKQSSSMQSSDSFLPTSQEGQANSVTQECLWLQGAGALWKTDGNVEMSVFLACYEFRGEAAAGFWSSGAWRIRPAASGFLSAPFWQRAGHQLQSSLREARCEGSLIQQSSACSLFRSANALCPSPQTQLSSVNMMSRGQVSGHPKVNT